MRFILSFRLETGAVIDIVTEAETVSDAKDTAIRLSSIVFKSRNMQIKNTSTLIRSERWGKDKVMAYKPGNKVYRATFLFNNNVQSIMTDGSDCKSAYNNVISKFALSNDISMFIYEPNQVIKRTDPMVIARRVIKDDVEIDLLTGIAVRAMRTNQKLNYYLPKFMVLLEILGSYLSGKYNGINEDKLISLIAVMIYITNPNRYSLDSYGIHDPVYAVTSLLRSMGKDVQAYRLWQSRNNSN